MPKSKMKKTSPDGMTPADETLYRKRLKKLTPKFVKLIKGLRGKRVSRITSLSLYEAPIPGDRRLGEYVE